MTRPRGHSLDHHLLGAIVDNCDLKARMTIVLPPFIPLVIADKGTVGCDR